MSGVPEPKHFVEVERAILRSESESGFMSLISAAQSVANQADKDRDDVVMMTRKEFDRARSGALDPELRSALIDLDHQIRQVVETREEIKRIIAAIVEKANKQ